MNKGVVHNIMTLFVVHNAIPTTWAKWVGTLPPSPTPYEQNDRSLWKHYLPLRSVTIKLRIALLQEI